MRKIIQPQQPGEHFRILHDDGSSNCFNYYADRESRRNHFDVDCEYEMQNLAHRFITGSVNRYNKEKGRPFSAYFATVVANAMRKAAKTVADRRAFRNRFVSLDALIDRSEEEGDSFVATLAGPSRLYDSLSFDVSEALEHLPEEDRRWCERILAGEKPASLRKDRREYLRRLFAEISPATVKRRGK